MSGPIVNRARELVRDPWLLALAAVSLALRWALVYRGGTLWSPDEAYRFIRPYKAWIALFAHDWPALRTALSHPDHPLFTWISLPPAGVHLLCARLFHLDIGQSDWLPASMLAVYSVLDILLVALIVRCVNGSPTQARWAAFFMACSTSMLFYSRNLLPYDFAMALALAGLCLGVRRNDSPARSMACGALGTFSFLTYLGNYTIAAAVVVVHALRGRRDRRLKRALWACLGGAVPGLLFGLVSQALSGGTFVAGLHTFSGTVTLGSYEEGWTHPWQFLWAWERALGILWLGGACLALGQRRSRRIARIWLAGIAVICFLIGIAACVLHLFVPYARQDREIVPFLCLLGAAGVTSVSKPFRVAVAAIAILQAAFTYSEVYAMRFPREMRAVVARSYGDVRYQWTWAGIPPQGNLASRYVLVDASVMDPLTQPIPPPAGRVLMRWPHPDQAFDPGMLDHYNRQERELIRHNDVSMRLIDTQ